MNLHFQKRAGCIKAMNDLYAAFLSHMVIFFFFFKGQKF